MQLLGVAFTVISFWKFDIFTQFLQQLFNKNPSESYKI